MTKRIYAADPEQNAELAAQHGMEARLTGVSVDTYWGEDDYQEDREWGDVGWDEEEMMEYRVDLHPVLDSEAMITLFIDAEGEDDAIAQALDLYEGARIIAVMAIG